MSVASDFAATITAENVSMSDAQTLRPAPYIGPGGLVIIRVRDDGNGELVFGTNVYPFPATVAAGLAAYLTATFV